MSSPLLPYPASRASSKAPIHVAAIQASPIAYDLPATLLKLRSLVSTAANEGAKLAVLPEAFLSAYPRNLGFKIGSRTDEDREWFSKYVESSVRIPDGAEGLDWLASGDARVEGTAFSAFTELCRIAADSKIHLSVGIIERSLVGSTLWCTSLLFSDSGVLLSKHRKLQPTAAERVVWSQGHARNPSPASPQGSTDNLPVSDTSIGKIGGLICWEHFMPLPRYALYQKGVEIWTAPTADGRDTWAPSMQHIAQEGRCFVISANQFHKSSDFPTSYPPLATHSDEVWCRGGSCIVDPLGRIIAGPLWDTEGVIYAEIDVAKLTGYKLDFDAVGHYSRDDLFELKIKE